ncbi:MAG: S8 family serine peptidase [Ignavibacteriales bacterium]|nr:MAG: S8 family serine peptidase [Ignavibacteriaceae bacterium]MBW7873192.1 S8 family serine peptidase [Ignavibacteria bacterium]MCZ2142834.1 S8 family serine peptidase [Ignavibacteriales bacterium]MBV6443928.1 hypothetical protein [Ignavibacteriaceae bacterium]MBZ0196229.1 S8 family serine peptidase [Ignavibacteriaceae bacterium]
MKGLITLLFIILFSFAPLNAQKNYMVFLKNKGYSGAFTYGSPLWNIALSSLSERSIERRVKTLGSGFEVSPEDLPVSPGYIARLEMTGAKIRWTLKWFNCVSLTADEPTVEKIKKLDFVERIRPVIKIHLPLEFENPLPVPNSEIYADAGNSDNGLVRGSKWNPPYLTQNFQDSQDAQNVHGNRATRGNDDDQKYYGGSYIQEKLSDVPAVHKMGGNGKGVRIGVLDSGFDWKRHESLNTRKVIAEYDFVRHDNVTANQENDPAGQDGHGTYCFSVCGGFFEGKLVAPSYNSEFVLAKTEATEYERMIEEDNYAAAIQFMDSIGVDITTSSLGYTAFDDTTYRYEDLNGETAVCTKAINYAFSKGILTFTASGNSAREPWYYVSTPGDGPNALAIGAVTKDRTIASFSSGGPTSDGRIKPDISAMGVSVYGAVSGTTDRYTRANGTSSATPLTAGIGGQLLSLFPHLKNTQARFILRYTADQRMLKDNVFGYGLVSSFEAATHPNLEMLPDGKIKLHKRFKDVSNAKSVFLVYKTGYKKSDRVKMDKVNDNYFTVILPQKAQKEAFEFYFDAGETQNGLNFPSFNRKYYTLPGNENVYIVTPDKFDFKEFAKERAAKYTGINPKIFVKAKPGEKDAQIFINSFLTPKTVAIIPVSDIVADTRYKWNGKDSDGKPVPPGIYTATVYVGGKLSTRQIFLRQ